MIIQGDASPATMSEIKSMIEKHGDCCVNYLEQKFDVLIIPGAQIEVYQLPEGEI